MSEKQNQQTSPRMKIAKILGSLVFITLIGITSIFVIRYMYYEHNRQYATIIVAELELIEPDLIDQSTPDDILTLFENKLYDRVSCSKYFNANNYDGIVADLVFCSTPKFAEYREARKNVLYNIFDYLLSPEFEMIIFEFEDGILKDISNYTYFTSID